MKFKKRRYWQVTRMAENTAIVAMETCAVEAEDGPVWATVSLNIRSVTGNVPDKKSSQAIYRKS